MLSSLLHVLAQIPPTTAPVAPGNEPFFVKILREGGILVPLSLFLIAFYFIAIRSKRKQDKERQDLLNNVKKGDTIETIGGILGTVVSADEKTLVLKVDETANTKLKLNRRAIHRVVTEDKG